MAKPHRLLHCNPLSSAAATTTTDQMAGANLPLAPHAACATSTSAPSSASASASGSISSDSTASANADVTVFRLLLPQAFGDEDARYLYGAIAPLRHHNSALQVRVDALEGYYSSSRVAVVLGPNSPSRRVEASSSSGEPLHLSPLQEALVALVDVGGVLHPAAGRGPDFVTCVVLVEAARLDAQGVGTLSTIASETGVDIGVTSLAEDAKPDLHSADELVLVEITGDITSIRKAIVALSSYVQGDLHAGSLTTSVTSLEVPETNFGALHSGGSTQYEDSSRTACSSHCERVLQKPDNVDDIEIIISKNELEKSVGGTSAVITEVQKPADGGGDRIYNPASCLPREVLELILGHLPARFPIPSYDWLCMISSMPRPTLLLPRHDDNEWKMLLPAKFALEGDILATSTLVTGEKLKHTTALATKNLGISAGIHPMRLVGGHPSQPIFMQGQVCIICSVITSNVYRYHLSIPGRREEGDNVLRGSISYSLLSAEPHEPASRSMLLLATDTNIFGRAVKDRDMQWAVGSLSGVQGAVTDMIFADGSWYLMDDRRFLYRVSFSKLELFVQEVEVKMIPGQIYQNVTRHWILQWPEGSILCICLQSRPYLPVGEARYSAYLLRYREGKRSSWQELHYLHGKSVFINGGKAPAFALKYPERWGLREDVVYHTDMTGYDLTWARFPNGIPPEEVQWPFPLWLLCRHVN